MELSPLFKAAFEAFPNFVIVDSECKIFYINDVYARLLGISQEDAIGRPVDEVIPNTKMAQTVESGIKETGAIMTLYDHVTQQEVSVVCNRIPLIEDGKTIGAVAMTTFNEFSEIYKLYGEIEQIKKENERYEKTIQKLKSENNPLDQIVGSSLPILELKQIISDFAKSNLSILLTGETGVGKEVFSNALHTLSNRKLNNFVKINCAAIPKDLLESELFGYEEGSFTGALKQGKIGKFELADQGTLLLDEIGEMPLSLQSKLLRVLQENEIERIGGLKPKKINVRVICSTNQKIQELVKEGDFREDLYYRINTVELSIPPLRERLSDLPALCDFFIQKINSEFSIHTRGIDNDVINLFKKYHWPGNIRELRHVIERLSFLNQDGNISLKDCGFLQKKMEASNKGDANLNTLDQHRHNAEKIAIMEALAQTNGNKSQAAKLLGIDRSILYNKLKKYQIS